MRHVLHTFCTFGFGGLVSLWAMALPAIAAGGGGQARVILFGGAQSTAALLDACCPGCLNVGANQSRVAEMVNLINANPSERFVVAGHSNGYLAAIQTVNQATNKDRLTFVNLDGNAPNALSPEVRNVVCWRAVNGRGGVSRNHGSMLSPRCAIQEVQSAPQCEQSWCMHFAMLNPNVRGDLNNSNWARGLDGCRPNAAWMRWRSQ